MVPKSRFILPSSITELNNFTEVSEKQLTFRKSIYSIADAVEGFLTAKHPVETAFGGADDETRMVSRLSRVRNSYYTSPSNKPHTLIAYLFGCEPPPSIMGKLLRMYCHSQTPHLTMSIAWVTFLKECLILEGGSVARGDPNPKSFVQRL